MNCNNLFLGMIVTICLFIIHLSNAINHIFKSC